MYVTELFKRSPRPFGSTLSAYFKKPMQVATVCPSSSAVTNKLVKRECIRRASTVVDLGAGTGSTTRALLKAMSPTATLVAVELTSEFIPELSSIDDRRLVIEHANALDLPRILRKHRLSKVDVIVSGIPFSVLDRQTGQSMMRNIAGCLRPGGHLVAYQFRNHVARLAEEVFASPGQTEKVWWNIPPLTIYHFTNTDNGI